MTSQNYRILDLFPPDLRKIFGTKSTPFGPTLLSPYFGRHLWMDPRPTAACAVSAAVDVGHARNLLRRESKSAWEHAVVTGQLHQPDK